MIAMIFFGCGVTYDEVTIGKQVWMTKNLNVDKFRNGDPIPEAKTVEEWFNAGEEGKPTWCYYDNNPENGERYGKLYNWFAVNDSRGLAPEGWEIPSDEDWTMLTDFLGGYLVAGKKMKFSDFWADFEGESGNGTNESGFSALPGACCYNGLCYNLGGVGKWWSASEDDAKSAWYRYIGCNSSTVCRGSENKFLGFSVRCVRDL